MTAAAFYRLVLALWGDHWQQPLGKLLRRHDLHYTRQTFWNWKTDKTPVPDDVAEILKQEKKERKTA